MGNIGLSGTTGLWILAIAAWAVLSLILIIALFSSNARLRRRVRHWQSIHETADLEKVYRNTQDRIGEVEALVSRLNARVEGAESQIRKKVSTAEVKRYNAFAETGSDLSFSVALLDDEDCGVVLSSIYGREESRSYAKPIAYGQSDYALTNEELDVIEGHRGSQRTGSDKSASRKSGPPKSGSQKRVPELV